MVLALLGWPGLARLERAEVLSLRSRDFIHAATINGASNVRIMTRHILPSVVPTMVIWVSLAIPGLILAEAALSFLGLGTQPPEAAWGSMLSTARTYIDVAPWLSIFPGLAIMIVVLGFNLLGDGLRDILDPRLGPHVGDVPVKK